MSEAAAALDLVTVCSTIGPYTVAVEARYVDSIEASPQGAEIEADGVDGASMLGIDGSLFGERRVARLVGSEKGCFPFALGEQVELRNFSSGSLRSFPPLLESLATTHGWTGLLLEDGRFHLLVTPQSLPPGKAGENV